MKEVERISVDTLDLSIRTSNTLLGAGILFIDELEEKTASDLTKFRHFGLKCLREIRKELARHGKCLKHDYVASTQDEKKLIEDLPKVIGEIKDQVNDLNRQIKKLYLTLDQLHLDINPKVQDRIPLKRL